MWADKQIDDSTSGAIKSTDTLNKKASCAKESDHTDIKENCVWQLN